MSGTPSFTSHVLRGCEICISNTTTTTNNNNIKSNNIKLVLLFLNHNLRNLQVRSVEEYVYILRSLASPRVIHLRQLVVVLAKASIDHFTVVGVVP